MGLIDKAKEWLIGRAVKKSLIQLAGAAAAYLAAKSVFLETWGVTVAVDPDVLAGALFAGFNLGRNWLKVKVPKIGAYL